MSLRVLIFPLVLFLTGCDRAPDSTPRTGSETPPSANPSDPSEKGSPVPEAPPVASQLDHQWKAVELWEGDSKSPDDVVNGTMVEFKEGTFKYILDGETNLAADYRIVEANTEPGKMQLIFSADGETQTINVVFTISDDQLIFAHPLSSQDRSWPEAVEKGADLVYAVFRRN